MILPRQQIDLSDDVHRQANLLRGWEQTYSQLGSGKFAGSVTTFHFAGLKVFREMMNRAVFQAGCLASGHLAFGLQVRGWGPSCICGEEGRPNTVLVFSGRSGFEFLSPEMFEFLGVELNALPFEDPVLQAMMHELEQLLSGRSRAIALSPIRAGKLQLLLDEILSQNELDGKFTDAPGQGMAFSRGFVGQLLDILQEADFAREGLVQRHWEAIAAIRELVTYSDNCPFSVAELTHITGLPRRTLQNACQSILGMSPIQYLRALRLSEARGKLQVTGSVTEVATHFGFWHLGYFSRDYNAMFDELPSRTVQNRVKDIRRHQ